MKATPLTMDEWREDGWMYVVDGRWMASVCGYSKVGISVVFKFVILAIPSAFPTVSVGLSMSHRVDMIQYAEPVTCHFCYQQCSEEGDFADLFGANIGVLCRIMSDVEIYLTSSVKAWQNDGNAITAGLGCRVQ